jgi:hypothetical protein
MGIDGRQFLEIRGAQPILDALEKSGIVFEGGDPMIAERFFGPKNVTVSHRSPRYLVVGYEFRNMNVYEYLKQLLVAHPTIWIKNEYKTEEGYCGLWIAQMYGGAPSIQDLEWCELAMEEQEYREDFSG